MYRDPSIFDVALFLIVIGLCLFSVLYDRFQSDPGPREKLRQRYETGEIGLEAYERELGDAMRALGWYRQFREIVLMFAIANIEPL